MFRRGHPHGGTVQVAAIRLRQTFATGKAEENLIPYTPQKTFDCAGETPVLLKFAANDDRLVVAFAQGPILVFDVNVFLNSSESRIQRPTPMVFPSEPSGYPRALYPNPGDHPELVAVLRGVYGQDRGLYVEVLDVVNHKIIGGWYSSTNLDAMPVSVSWSPRGKQIAIGTHSGDILLYTPQDTSMLALKGHVPRPSNPALNECCPIATTWLANPTFHVVYAPPQAIARYDAESVDAPEETHLIVQHDKNPANNGEVTLENPCLPYGAKRVPGPLNVVLKNWGSVKFLIFAGDGPASDIGVIGCVGEQWGNLALEETSRPALPLTAEMDESALFGLELDLTANESLDMSEQPGDDTPQLPPAPILMAYTSEGALVAWHVIAQREGQYPGMTSVPGSSLMSARPITPPPTNTQPASQPSPFSQPAAAQSTSPFGAPKPTGAFGTTSTAPAFGSTSFGSSAAPAFGSTGFGSTAAPAAPATSAPSFGGGGFSAFESGNKPSFGGAAPSGTSPFAAAAAASSLDTKPATSTTTTTSPFGAASTASPFGAPASKPAFGQTGFGFGQAPAAASPAAPTFGQSSLGFGQPAKPPAGPTAPAAPASGGAFGAFASKPSTFGAAAASATETTTPAASSPFGKPPAFGATSTPAPAFGQTGFGFGAAPKAPAALGSSSTPASGGFGAFAGKTASFGSAASSPPASDTSPKPAEAPKLSTPPATTGLGAFTKPGSGFGAFGSAQGGDSKPSPFALAAAGAAEKKESVASAGFGKPTSLGSLGLGKPPGAPSGPTAFGQTSSLGFGVKPPAQDKPKEAAPAAPSFGSGGGFAAFAANRTTSFGGTKPAEGKEDAAKTIFGGTSSKPTQAFSSIGLGRALNRKDDDDDDEPARKEAFPETEITDKEPTTEGDAALSFGSLGLGLGAPPAAAAPPSSTPTTTPAKGASTPQTSPSKTPATPSTHGLFSTPGSTAFGTAPKTDTTPTPSPSKTPSTPAAGFGAFGKGTSTSGFGSFANSTPIASAFSPQSTPKTESTPSTPTSATPSAAPGPVFGQSNIFGGSSIFGQSSAFGGAASKFSAPTAPSGSAFSAFATPGKPSGFGQTPANDKGKGKEKEKDDDEKSSSPSKSPSLLDRIGAAPAKSPSLLDRMGPPPPSRVEPLPPDSEEEGEGDDDLEEVDLPEGEGAEEYDSEEEDYDLEDGEDGYGEEEGEEDEEEEEGEEGELQDDEPGHTGAFDKPKAKSEEAPASGSAFRLTPPPTKTETSKAASEPPPPVTAPIPRFETPTGGVVPSKAFPVGGRPVSAFGGMPARSSPLASNPPFTADEEASGPSKATQQKPALNLSLPPKPAFSPFPGFTDAEKKPSPPLFPTAPTPTSANSMLGGMRSGAPSPVSAPFPKPPFSLGPSPSPPPTMTSPARLNPPPVTPTTQSQQFQPTPGETPLQQQFAEIYLGVEARKIVEQRAQIVAPRGGRTLQDLANVEKWGISDLAAFQQIVKGLDRETATLKEHAIDIAKSFAELQSLQLQAEVKQEEMVRYSKANKDPEFKRMINVRGLGPEQEESQAKLRKQMQTVGDRIQQLEDVLESQRRRLEMHRTGRHRIEAPTLDTVNRTCRNIDIALDQRAAEVSRLVTAVDALRISPAVASPPRVKTNAETSKHARQASVAHARAANDALAAENTAARLKNLLSRARTEPLLSVASDAPAVQTLRQSQSQHQSQSQSTAAVAPASRPLFGSTASALPSSGSLNFFNRDTTASTSAPIAPLFNATSFPKTPPPALPAFNWPTATALTPTPSPDAGDSTSSLANRAGGSGSRRQARHVGSVKLPPANTSPSPTANPQAAKTAAFDWGPLQDFSPPTAKRTRDD
ncbi:hypothetical protein EXIGLDRAFT_703530 [Exidia glandulosa HHB12029]|uniref:Nucleoporin Nup159/Nup146 N-terminal domain-containing protein n=1 Tax=Exidia glandulosa HHB12029 TaxID=1314781 RepID=A0A165PWN6_EXIGL|nr:hypothetical protein EXIGLDRAFT_703530 [Exidia glandulosa HHB12029]